MFIRICTIAAFFVFSGMAARLIAGSGSPHVPFTFAENRGQADPSVRYIGSGSEFKAWFEDRGVILRQGKTTVKIAFEGTAADVKSQATMTARTTIIAGDPLGAKANYLFGSDPGQWQTDLPLFGSIRYKSVWPGVDLTYEVEHGNLKAEYQVAPGAGIERILLRFDGNAQIQPNGTLRIHGPYGDFVEEKPLLYQSIGGWRRDVAGGFQELSDGAIGFTAAEYDRTQALVIDPSILLSGYFGGSAEDSITAVGIDALSNIVTAGWTSSNDLPVSSGAQTQYGGSVDAFVAGFLPNGGTLIYCTYLGGSGDDRAFGLAIDSTRDVYITGWTSSPNFPMVGAFQIHLAAPAMHL